MTNNALVEQKLPEDLWEQAKSFVIPEKFLLERPDLIEMVLRSKSIDTKEEKQNRFNLLPMMNDGQVEKLEGILDKEKKKLAEIEQKYQKRKKEIKEKYLNKREDMGYVKKVSDIKEEEASVAQKDQEDAEDLLLMI